MTPNLPLGYRFMPTDAELIWYLLAKVSGSQLPSDKVTDGEIYGDDAQLPEEDRIGNTEMHMFVKNEKNQNGTKTNRKTKNGFWKDTGHKKEIKDDRGNHIGTKTSFGLTEKNKFGRSRKLLMDEYTLDGLWKNTINSEGWVLCKIKQSDRSLKRQAEEEGENSCTLTQTEIAEWVDDLYDPTYDPGFQT